MMLECNKCSNKGVRYYKKISKGHGPQSTSEEDHKGGEAQAKSFPMNGSQPGDKSIEGSSSPKALWFVRVGHT